MKYLVVLGDGMADRPLRELGWKTPLQVAKTKNMDALAKKGWVGLVKTIPNGLTPGSDIANLSVLGYDPRKYYSGRSPLEALSLGVELEEGDVAIRANLVTLSAKEPFEEKKMIDYGAGDITTEESRVLIEEIEKELGNEGFTFYAGVSYRHCLIVKDGTTDTEFTPPHDISGQKVIFHLPEGKCGKEYIRMIKKSELILENHPINLKRIKEGKNPATHLWFWGAGTRPELTAFSEKYGVEGSIISAVDLLKGLAIGTGLSAPMVEGATGRLDSNWDGKIAKAIEEFKEGKEMVYLHLEAPDECSHQGDIAGKIKAIEKVDYVLGELYNYLEEVGEPFRIAVLPDHSTPINTKTHASEPVPYLLYFSDKAGKGFPEYNEEVAQSGKYIDEGTDIMKMLLEK